MATASKAFTVWHSMPDPTGGAGICSVSITKRSLEHIAEKHVRNETEPWGAGLPPELVGRLTVSMDNRELSELASALQQAARDSLNKPILLICTRTNAHCIQSRHSLIWLLVLRWGATMYLRGNNSKTLRTCMIPRCAAYCTNPRRRVPRVISRLVWRYGKRLPSGVWDPPPEHAIAREGVVESGIRFVTPENWGFVPGPSGSVYRGRITVWSDELLASPRLGRLKRRSVRPAL